LHHNNRVARLEHLTSHIFDEMPRGTLEPGKLADFAIPNQDFPSLPVERIGTTASLLTVVGGKTVYAADEFSHVR